MLYFLEMFPKLIIFSIIFSIIFNNFTVFSPRSLLQLKPQ